MPPKTYRNFLQTENLIERLLRKLELIKDSYHYWEVSISADNDLFPGRQSFDTFYFKNNWPFGRLFEAVLEVEITDNNIFTLEDIREMSRETGIYFSGRVADIADFLSLAEQHESDVMESYGFGTELDQFNLQCMRVAAIDNLRKKIIYEGTYEGDDYFEGTDGILFSKAAIKAVPITIHLREFYYSLLAESYLLYLQGNWKLSYFTLYSAFESFINDKSDDPAKEERLSDRITSVFKARFTELGKHEIYTNIKGEFVEFSNTRNSIVHGRDDFEIFRVDLHKKFIAVLLFIAAYEFRYMSFEQISADITDLN